jgi:predicted kinase
MEALILSGLPGAGKSTFCRDRLWDTHIRLNLDMLKTRHREKMLLHALIEARQRFVVDNTNPTPADRARYIVPAKAASFSVVAYHFDVAFEVARHRNAQRQGQVRVPDKGLGAIGKVLVPPSWVEGFDAIFHVRAVDGLEFDLQEIAADEL